MATEYFRFSKDREPKEIVQTLDKIVKNHGLRVYSETKEVPKYLSGIPGYTITEYESSIVALLWVRVPNEPTKRSHEKEERYLVEIHHTIGQWFDAHGGAHPCEDSRYGSLVRDILGAVLEEARKTREPTS